ncbi:MAG TPA: hypothetical protein PKA63_12395 [Oligoflexia bacterium]|nr:hypothetical protein [Oligoflexia bacterium]HMP49456.1 hypothetical protein [Oligoflexia bacterium]
MRNNLDKQRNELINHIRSAFHSECRGDSISLHQAIAILEEASNEEQISARQKDIDENWWDLTKEDIQKCYFSMALIILSRHPKSFRYYLPAVMTHAIIECFESCDFLNEATNYFFEHDRPNTFRLSDPSCIVKKFGFNSEHINAIVSYLEFCLVNELTGSVSPKAFGDGVKKWKDMQEFS